jgi:hypothetical protein
VDAQQVGRFLAAVRDLLSHPERLELRADQLIAGAGSLELSGPMGTDASPQIHNRANNSSPF